MDKYCLEKGLKESDCSIIHKVKCSHIDLGSLLETGRINCLGEFADSIQALNFTREKHPDAIRCLECCHADLVFPLSDWQNPACDPVLAS